jgi:uncharacterized protein (DUF2249 family)
MSVSSIRSVHGFVASARRPWDEHHRDNRLHDPVVLTDMSRSDGPPDARELDVRDVEGEPFSEIVAALADLPEDGTLVLINSFEPKPLYGELDERGFAHRTTRVGPDEWRVVIESP